MSRFHVWFLVRQLKSDRGCVDCGEKDADLLDFDHVCGEKVANISELYAGSIEKICEELSKCDVRCVRCHRQITSARRALADVEIYELDEAVPRGA